MTMHVNLSPEMESFIRSKVATGFYGSATEVIRDALRRMQAEETRSDAWKAAIRRGEEQLDRGEVIACGDESLNEITQAAFEAMHGAKPIDPDVLP